MPNLTTLILSGSKNIVTLDFVTRLHNLKHLEIDNVENVCSHSFTQCIPKCEQLSYLSMQENTHIDKYQLVTMAKNSPQLKYLDITGCGKVNPGAVQTILSNCTKMKNFYFSAYYFVSDGQCWILVLDKQFPNVTYSANAYAQLDWFKNFY